MNSIIDLEKEGLEEKLTGILIGQGSFGIVTKCVWRGKNVAIKRFLREQKSYLAELNNLIKVDHENIIQCFAFKQSENMIIMEYAEDGSLHQLLHSPRYTNLTYNLAHALNWALQTAKGVLYLHSIKPKLIIHRDLKPLNILLKSNFSLIKICDFGTACPNKSEMTQNQGSIPWMAPEVMKGCKYNEKCDIFSWGIIFWELLSRKAPHSNPSNRKTEDKSDELSTKSTNCTTYPNYSPYAIYWSVTAGNRPKLLKNCPKVFEDLIVTCWSDKPESRPSMNEIVDKMELYFSLVKDEIYPIDSSKIKPEDSQNYCLTFSLDDIKICNPNSAFENYPFAMKKCIPDNVELEPHSEIVTTTKNKANEASVIKHCINFAPISGDSEALEVLDSKKPANKKGPKFLSTIIDENVIKFEDFCRDNYANDLINDCGISSISRKIVTDMFNIKPKSRSTFYLEEATDCSQISELDSKFSTLTPNDSKDNNLNDNEYTKQHIITKHKKHRSEIEINNCKQLNSSASSTISSSSTSIVIDKKLNDQATTFKTNREVNNFFDSTNSSSNANEDDETLECLDDYNLGSSCSSFESVDKEEIKNQIERELPHGQQIKYKIAVRERGVKSRLKKVFRPKHDLHLPSDL